MSFVLVQVIVGGLLLGAVCALFSSGLTLVWGMIISGVGLVVWMDRHDSHLPVAPVPRRLLIDCPIRTHKKMMIGVDEAAVSLCLRNAVAKARPCLREEYADAAGDPGARLPTRRQNYEPSSSMREQV
jgi:hypothetical protein